MEGVVCWCYGNGKLQENTREFVMQYPTVQYLLAMESLNLLVMKLNILVADTVNPLYLAFLCPKCVSVLLIWRLVFPYNVTRYVQRILESF